MTLKTSELFLPVISELEISSSAGISTDARLSPLLFLIKFPSMCFRINGLFVRKAVFSAILGSRV